MQAIYKVEGMTCQGCADNIQSGLNNQSFVTKANVSLQESKLTIEADSGININSLNSIVTTLGNYKLRPNTTNIFSEIINYFTSKKPIVIALSIVILSSLALQTSEETFSLNKWFMSYMGIFFIIFSFLKLLNVSGFSMTFKKYDLISKIIPAYANSYPFIELSLGIIFLTQTQSILIYANVLTLIFMISQTIGIIKSLSKSEQIQCACMGSAVDVPLSSLTVAENIIMIAMATYMIIQFL